MTYHEICVRDLEPCKPGDEALTLQAPLFREGLPGYVQLLGHAKAKIQVLQAGTIKVVLLPSAFKDCVAESGCIDCTFVGS
eukprot:3964382-Amphidinium_carterae.1